ncbi:MAG TPA: DUF4185 domain-containing protein [Labilithrix sp.]|nr:DUF4185 domain-containing protein [Labilithrix sp.]
MKSLTLNLRTSNYGVVACVLGSVVASLIGCAAESSHEPALPDRVEVDDQKVEAPASTERAASDTDTRRASEPATGPSTSGPSLSNVFANASANEIQTPSTPFAGFGTIWSPSASWRKRLTGADLDTNHRWQVAGTDLGIPYVLENGSIGYLFGDTFNTPFPEGPPVPNDWRSPVMLRSASHPRDGIVFDSAAKVGGNGRAPELFYNAHDTRALARTEWTVIPNDGISFPETGRQVISFMSVNHWRSAGVNGPHWRTTYASLAYSDNGNDFTRVPYLGWENNDSNTDPFQMWTMQRDGDWVYVFSVRAGRQDGPMMLQRVHWRSILDKRAYQGWGWNGSNWGWGRPCTPILNGRFGEPSVRKLANGTWAMSYLNAANGTIVTRTAKGPDQPWSGEKVQVASWQEPSMYGGFIHPWSSTGENNLHIMVSKWAMGPDGRSTAYHVSHYVGTL